MEKANKMAQEVEAPVAKPGNLSAIPGTHMVHGEMPPTSD